MRKRTQARELALKVLYQADITGKAIAKASEDFFANEEIDEKEVVDFCNSLLAGVEKNLPDIDKKISEYALNWEFKRIAIVDRNVLRLGIFELRFSNDIPPKVAINEAVELAKKFGDLDSSKFVNGILDNIHKTEVSAQTKQ